VNDNQTQTDSAMTENQLFQTALDSNGESFKLWSAYVEWIERKWQDDALTSDIVDDLFTVRAISLSSSNYTVTKCTQHHYNYE
jgi:hypothetical protein